MNSVVRTGLITAEPVSLASMRNWLRIAPNWTTDDVDIADLITEARQHCELLTNCSLVRSTFVQYLDHFPGHSMRDSASGIASSGHDGFGTDGQGRWRNEIKVKRPPLVSVQDILFIGTDGRPGLLSPGTDFIVDVASRPGRIRPIPYTTWPLTLHVPAAVAIRFTAGYAPNSDGVLAGQTAISEPEADTSAIATSWQPTATFAQYAYQVDENDNIWIQTTSPSGLTGAPRPGFEGQAIGAAVSGDGTANWLNVGPLRGFWTPGTAYAGLQAYVVLDFNSNLQLLNVASLFSESIVPYSLQIVGTEPLPWATATGLLTTDNKVTGAWRCLGAYTALGNAGLALPNSPEQQGTVLVDRTLPKVVTRAIKALVVHWYRNREPVTQGSAGRVPMHIDDMLGSITIHDFAPNP